MWIKYLRDEWLRTLPDCMASVVWNLGPREHAWAAVPLQERFGCVNKLCREDIEHLIPDIRSVRLDHRSGWYLFDDYLKAVVSNTSTNNVSIIIRAAEILREEYLYRCNSHGESCQTHTHRVRQTHRVGYIHGMYIEVVLLEGKKTFFTWGNLWHLVGTYSVNEMCIF